MRKILLSTIALVAMAGAAYAADLPSTKSAPVYIPPPPVFSWTGLYIGVEGGGDFRWYNDRFATHTVDKDAGLIGGVIGYNWATPSFGISNLVIGLEGDAAAVLGGDQAYYYSPYGGSYNGYNNTYNSNYAAAIRGRVGLAWDRALFYAAGGVAFGDAAFNFGGPNGSYTSDRVGWTIGGGLDYAFTPNWIGRIEYRYVDLGSGNYNNYHNQNEHVEVTSSQVMAAMMYKFGAPMVQPVVAKY